MNIKNKTRKIEIIMLHLYFLLTYFTFHYVKASNNLNTDVIYIRWNFYINLLIFVCLLYLSRKKIFILFGEYKKIILLFLIFSFLMLMSNISNTNLSSLKNSLILIVITIIFIFNPILYMNISKLKIEDIFKIIIYSLIIFGILSSVIALQAKKNVVVEILGISVRHRKKYTRIYGIYGNPNRMATFISLAIIANYEMLINMLRSYIFKFISFISLAFLVYSLIQTQSRGSFIGLIVSMFIMYLIRYFIRHDMSFFLSKKTVITSLLSILILVALSVVFLKAQDRSFNLNGRLNIWTDSFLLFRGESLSSKIFGSGTGYISKTLDKSSHNGFVRWLVEYGLAFILFLGIAFFKSITQLYKKITSFPIRSFNYFFLNVILFLLLKELTGQALFSLRFEYFIFLTSISLLVYNQDCGNSPAISSQTNC